MRDDACASPASFSTISNHFFRSSSDNLRPLSLISSVQYFSVHRNHFTEGLPSAHLARQVCNRLLK